MEGVELVLNPPPKTQTLAATRKQRQKWAQKYPEISGTHGARKTKRKLSAHDPLHGIVRNGNFVRWS